jgi:uncharacterized protein YabN with tetrapyrrole methylase and pyrophosphatase domain
MINAARLYKINPENALERTNRKFIRRFNYLEQKTLKQARLEGNVARRDGQILETKPSKLEREGKLK